MKTGIFIIAFIAVTIGLGGSAFAADPTPEPTITAEPTTELTVQPTAEPTIEPTVEPTSEPTPEPTAAEVLNPCHPAYTGCLPITDDLNCGDLTYQVQIVVPGEDPYELDGTPSDGIGCNHLPPSLAATTTTTVTQALPVTGSSITPILVAGSVMLVIGVALITAVSRRRRDDYGA